MKKSKLLLVSSILSSIYLLYLIYHFIGGILESTETTSIIAGSVATFIVAPHMLFVALSLLFNWIGWAMNLRWAALVSGILYVISIILMFIYTPFVIIQMILSFVAYSRMMKKDVKNAIAN